MAGLFSAAILARVLGPDGFGMLGFGIAFLSFVGIVATLGTDTYGMRIIARNPAEVREITNPILGLRLCLACIAYLVFAAIVVLLDRTAAEKSVLMIQGGGLFVTALMLDFVFQGLERMRVNGLRQISTALLTLTMVYIFVRTPDDIERAASAPVIAGAIAVACVFIFARQSIAKNIRFSVSLSAWKKILAAALPLSITMVMQTIIVNTDIFMLGLIAGNESTGLYTGAFRIISLMLVPAGLLIASFTPSLASGWQDPALRASRSRTFTLSVLLLGLPMVIFVGLFPEQILRLFFGEPFGDASTALALLSAGMIATYLSVIYGSPLFAWNQERFIMKVTLVGALTNVCLNFVLIPTYGIDGAAIASLISQLLIAVGYAIGFQPRTSTLHLVLVGRVLLCLVIAAAGNLVFYLDFGAGAGAQLLALLANGFLFGLLYLATAFLVFRKELRGLLTPQS